MVAALVFPALALADHVNVSGEVRAELVDPVSRSSQTVVVTWSALCLGAVGDTSYYGSLDLIDLDTGERTYLGGVSSAAGTVEVSVERRARVRQLVPYLKISCSIRFADGESHGDGPIELTGVAILVPPLDGGGGASGGGSGAGGGPTGPAGLPPGACAREIRGSGSGETIVGTGANENVLALGGNDVVRGRGGHDCLRGGSGNDRLEGEAGSDALYGGAGSDVLVGGPGRNVYEAGPGDDTVRAANGRAETVSCGAGDDTARVDASDDVIGCEHVTRV